MLSEQQLKDSYMAFTSNFDPSKLKALDGELLAETMFNHGNKSSLVYWLEFKSDEEFQNSQFGGIAGGSAFKFGLYKRKEDGKWIAGSPTKSKELSLEEAIALAREKRDMLVKGAQLIDQLDKNAPASDYITLQTELEGVLNGLENTGWAHKYYHMLFPDKIDAFHSADWQKYYLMKMGLIPQGDGRYAMAGQFVELARDAGMSIHYVSRSLGRMFDSIHYYWRIGTTPGKMNYWEEMLAGGYAATGWGQVGDMREYENLNRNELCGAVRPEFAVTTMDLANNCLLCGVREARLSDIRAGGPIAPPFFSGMFADPVLFPKKKKGLCCKCRILSVSLIFWRGSHES